MDKALFRAYVKELVKEQLEETVEKTVRKVLPDILGEAVAEIKGSQRVTENTTSQKAKLSRTQLAEMMGLERLGDTLSATTSRMVMPENVPANLDLNSPQIQPAVEAITRDYSFLMKKMGLSK